MKWVIPILVLVGILIFRQAPAEPLVIKTQSSHPVLWEKNRTSGIQEYGWITCLDQNDPKVLPPVFHAFRNEQASLTGVYIPVLFRFSYHHRTNPLLIDRPPPSFMV